MLAISVKSSKSFIFSNSLNDQVISLEDPCDLFCILLNPFVTDITRLSPSIADAARPYLK